jgi:site-specific DNA-methyltransferase (adenine-specific)
MAVNRLILGDNLEILKSMENDCIDLIYLDPPFFSNRNYEVIWGDSGEIRSFQDRWAGGMSHYIDWLKERVIEMHRVLKPTGSLFLHCDWHADAYIRVHVLDRIFGEKNFLSAIDWCYEDIGGKATRYFKRKKDTIFFYQKSKDKKRVFNQQLKPLSESTLKRYGKYFDENGKITYQKLKNVSPGAFAKLKGIPDDLSGIWLDKNKGQPISDWWTDITAIRKGFSEAIGYPTQKPEALMERIINCATNKGDIVLDPFVGGGTTIAIADKLEREWVGIDQSPMAVKVTEFRLQKQADLFSAPYTVQLYKYDYDTLRDKDAFEFENWIVQQFGGTGNVKQRGDFGLDGKTGDNTPIQVKRSDNIGRNVIDNFLSAVQRYDKTLFAKNVKANNPVGYIIAFSFGKGAIEEVARLKNENKTIIKLVRVEEIVPIAVKPVIGLHINELEKDDKGNRKIEFVAHGQSPAGIEFYSWDFAYNKDKGFKPSVIIDKEGKQVLSLKAGTHFIAVKVVDNEGLENTEIIQLKINGGVKEVKD